MTDPAATRKGFIYLTLKCTSKPNSRCFVTRN